MALPVDFTETWDIATVVLSYIIAVTGSFCTIQIMEQWRMHDSTQEKRILMFAASISLGGCGIWAMHFTGMNAQHTRLADGSVVQVDFELGMTILSLVFPIVGVFVGLTIASRDPFFLEIEHERRKAIVADDLRTMAITSLLKKSEVQRRIKFIALFSRLWRILLGGLWAALGVLGMHYLGMMAQRSVLSMRFDHGFVAASCGIAFAAATAAFWIIFRALTFWPSIDALRVGSAMVMGIAVCGTHYTGMAAARLSMKPMETMTAEEGGIIVDGTVAFRVATNGSLVVCFWLVSLTVVRDLRSIATSARGLPQNSTITNGQQGSRGRASPVDSTTVLPFQTSSVPRNAVQPSGFVTSNNTVVARLPNNQPNNYDAAAASQDDFDRSWDIVPGTV